MAKAPPLPKAMRALSRNAIRNLDLYAQKMDDLSLDKLIWEVACDFQVNGDKKLAAFGIILMAEWGDRHPDTTPPTLYQELSQQGDLPDCFDPPADIGNVIAQA